MLSVNETHRSLQNPVCVISASTRHLTPPRGRECRPPLLSITPHGGDTAVVHAVAVPRGHTCCLQKLEAVSAGGSPSSMGEPRALPGARCVSARSPHVVLWNGRSVPLEREKTATVYHHVEGQRLVCPRWFQQRTRCAVRRLHPVLCKLLRAVAGIAPTELPRVAHNKNRRQELPHVSARCGLEPHHRTE